MEASQGWAEPASDILFFTQELSTLLISGVPLDRALTITSELTERPQFAVLYSIFFVCSRAESLLRTASRRSPITFRICT